LIRTFWGYSAIGVRTQVLTEREGDCHYIEGNLKTVRKIPLLKRYLEQFGINPKRLKYIFISASEGVVLTEIAREYSEELKELGPSPIRGGN